MSFSIVLKPEVESANLGGTCEKCCYGHADGEDFKSNFFQMPPSGTAL